MSVMQMDRREMGGGFGETDRQLRLRTTAREVVDLLSDWFRFLPASSEPEASEHFRVPMPDGNFEKRESDPWMPVPTFQALGAFAQAQQVALADQFFEPGSHQFSD